MTTSHADQNNGASINVDMVKCQKCGFYNCAERDYCQVCNVSLNNIIPKSKSAQDTINQRYKIYGDFKTDAATAQDFKGIMRMHKGYAKLTLPQREALELIFTKIGRILNGDPDYADNWHDIQGYAKLIENSLVQK